MSNVRLDPPRTASRLSLAVACGAAFVTFLDFSVVNIAFPTIAADYAPTTTSTLTWVVSGYAIAFAAFLTPAGRFADAIGRRVTFIAALAVFAAASLLCALAPSIVWLIVGRIAQGVAAALMIPAGLGLLLSLTAPTRVSRAIAAWTATGGFAAAVGPAIGGALVDGFSWRAAFFLNIPVCLVLVGLALLVPSEGRPSSKGLPDGLGTFATAAAIGLLTAAVTEGQTWSWDSLPTIACAVIGVALLAIALFRSFHHPRPAIAVGLWRNRTYAITNATSFVFGTAMFAWLLAGPLWLTQVWHYSILEAAGAMTIGAVVTMLTAAFAGRIPLQHQRTAAIAGALMFAACVVFMSTQLWGVVPRFWAAWIPSALLGGAGIGFALTAIGATAARSLSPTQFASGVGMTLTARQSGGALGVAILAAVFSAGLETLNAFHLVFIISALFTMLAALTAAATPPISDPLTGRQRALAPQRGTR